MNANLNKAHLASAAILRLRSLVPLNPEDLAALERASLERCEVSPRCELQVAGMRIKEPLLLLSGWAYHAQVLLDGRRQISGFLLPGDLIGNCQHSNPAAATSVIALTPVSFCRAPMPARDHATSSLAEAYALSAATDMHHLYRHITRLGRLSAFERIADWLLEIRQRLQACGLAAGTEFPLPLTQEVIADTLGLTNVHVNRTLQAMRRDGLVEIRSGRVKILDEHALESLVQYHPPTVTL